MYVSDSLVHMDPAALERIVVQARTNNALDGITGLLWTDAERFAQVIEGDSPAITALLAKLESDPRHANLTIVRDVAVQAREFGTWTMTQPAVDPRAGVYERRMLDRLSWLRTDVSGAFASVVTAARACAD